MATPDWINGAVSGLRAWRDARPEVVDPVMPPGVSLRVLAPEGECPGGLEFVPLASGEASGGDIYGQMKSAPVVYFHGGGFIVGSPETHRVVTAWIAAETGARVVSIRYRLAPEHVFPAQAEDAVAALRRQLAMGGEVRIIEPTDVTRLRDTPEQLGPAVQAVFKGRGQGRRQIVDGEVGRDGGRSVGLGAHGGGGGTGLAGR